MYGLPGDPNSQRLNRNAAETRIHTLWNHLVETGSRETGSLLIWDTGTYQILPRRSKHAPAIDPDSEGNESEDSLSEATTEQEKLHAAFANRKIRLRLNGTRLPRGYTVYLRVTKKEDAAGRMKALRSASGVKPRRRRARRGQAPKPAETSSSASESEPEPDLYSARADQAQNEGESEGLSAVERELREVEDDEIRRTNAYTGASNTIASVYQRRWYLSLDRSAAGFVKMRKQGGTVWEMGDGCSELPGSAEENDSRLNYPFYVKGPEHERSVVTGRLGQEILRDEGVSDYAGRKGWCPVLN
ncbi:hypothetical protein GQ53DRAFT_741506 [Thozetella sp. PMI_491]|nr:hypothetical protein GQ53DRAFT_741506 [Thozetella sp. PMI_491]